DGIAAAERLPGPRRGHLVGQVVLRESIQLGIGHDEIAAFERRRAHRNGTSDGRGQYGIAYEGDHDDDRKRRQYDLGTTDHARMALGTDEGVCTPFTPLKRTRAEVGCLIMGHSLHREPPLVLTLLADSNRLGSFP